MFSNFEATGREIFVSIIGAIMLISLGFFISTAIHNWVTEMNEPYLRALKINKDVDLFDHALSTEVGYTLAQGYLETPKPVTNDRIKGEYLSILEIEEHYVQKTRVVTETVNGKTKTRTETYWEWDEVNRKQTNAEKFTFLGKEFNTNKLKLNTHKTNSTVSKGVFTNVRFVYRTIPSEFNTALFFKAKDKTITETAYYPDKTNEQVVEEKEKEADNYVVLFWVMWLITIVLGAIGFIAMENRYLNSLGK